MVTVDFKLMSDAELRAAVQRLDWEKFPENYAAAVAEMEHRKISVDDKDTAPAGGKAIVFKGDGPEFFRIWIVNICLSVLTFGIYSAWAKVRTRQYFLRNTYLGEANFDYHGDPIRILKGRLMLVFLFVLYSAGPHINRWMSAVVVLIFWGLFPWIVVRANIFNLSNTSYRNIRFGFQRDYEGSYRKLAFAMFITVITLGFGIPFFWFSLNEFRISRSRYGTKSFQFSGIMDDYFKAYYGTVGLGAFAVLVLALVNLVFSQFGAKGSILIGVLDGLAIFCLLLPGYAALYSYLRARLFNIMVNKTTLGEVSFHSSLSGLELCKVYVGNFFACVFSFGLLIPWALVRLQKFKLSHITVVASEEVLSSFVAEPQQTGSATADALGDFWDIDLGL